MSTFTRRLRLLELDEAPQSYAVDDTEHEVLRSTELEVVRDQVHREVIAELDDRLFRIHDIDEDGLRDTVERQLSIVLDRQEHALSATERAGVSRDVLDDVLGYGPIDRYVHDDSVTEIMVNGPDDVYVERDGRIYMTTTHFVSDAHLRRIIDRIVSAVGRHVDDSSPMVDARLPDGSRVNVILPPLSIRGPILTIRKFRQDVMTMSDLVARGSITADAATFLEACVAGRVAILVSGGTGSGKTTLLNALSGAIPAQERIVTIEDSAELRLHQRHVIPLESRQANLEGRGQVTIRDLVRNTLRMRPDRIVVGEVRGVEAVDMLQAMNTGHDGSMSTIHANSPRDALARLETLVLTSDVELPSRAIRERIASALDVVVHVARLIDGTRRITHIAEVGEMEGDQVTMQPLWVAEHLAVEGDHRGGIAGIGDLHCTGIVPSFLGRLRANGVEIPASTFLSEIPD